ncbi:PREDICTED: bidirectional sugar transporter SWEET3-like isoform X3 [Brassica oleracea var. oleracea]|uniref:bidirectional sugar transporter SWEET3-like isoform X3 n=1 Tax=Brassica oleracea var. oleracea TaxID=109376 RepID=UPI0006A7092D|nr:PREDICTED: bidirectional sugar transporter SWEET3-like isoform X3 [Brassica oleracea var. oleracea]
MKMGDKLRLSVGILGNGASLLLYTAPVLTFSRVFKKKSTEEFSCLPYVMTLFNCLIYTWYGLPIVSHCWENFPLVSINGVGIVLESIFIFVYFCYASPKEKIKVGVIFVPVIVVFGLTTAISAVVFEDHRHRKSFVGSVGLVASISMYGSPLIVMLPNMVGTPLGILQLIIYFKYKNKKEAPITTTVVGKWDHEKNKSKLELVVDVDHDADADDNEKKFMNAC